MATTVAPAAAPGTGHAASTYRTSSTLARAAEQEIYGSPQTSVTVDLSPALYPDFASFLQNTIRLLTARHTATLYDRHVTALQKIVAAAMHAGGLVMVHVREITEIMHIIVPRFLNGRKEYGRALQAFAFLAGEPLSKTMQSNPLIFSRDVPPFFEVLLRLLDPSSADGGKGSVFSSDLPESSSIGSPRTTDTLPPPENMQQKEGIPDVLRIFQQSQQTAEQEESSVTDPEHREIHATVRRELAYSIFRFAERNEQTLPGIGLSSAEYRETKAVAAMDKTAGSSFSVSTDASGAGAGSPSGGAPADGEPPPGSSVSFSSVLYNRVSAPRLLEKVKAVQKMATAFRREENRETLTVIISALKAMSQYKNLAKHLVNSGLMPNLLQILRGRPVGGEALVETLDVLWNCLEQQAELTGEALCDSSVFDGLRESLLFCFGASFKRAGKLIRNDMTTILLFLARQPASWPFFASSGVLSLLLSVYDTHEAMVLDKEEKERERESQSLTGRLLSAERKGSTPGTQRSRQTAGGTVLPPVGVRGGADTDASSGQTTGRDSEAVAAAKRSLRRPSQLAAEDVAVLGTEVWKQMKRGGGDSGGSLGGGQVDGRMGLSACEEDTEFLRLAWKVAALCCADPDCAHAVAASGALLHAMHCFAKSTEEPATLHETVLAEESLNLLSSVALHMPAQFATLGGVQTVLSLVEHLPHPLFADYPIPGSGGPDGETRWQREQRSSASSSTVLKRLQSLVKVVQACTESAELVELLRDTGAAHRLVRVWRQLLNLPDGILSALANEKTGIEGGSGGAGGGSGGLGGKGSPSGSQTLVGPGGRPENPDGTLKLPSILPPSAGLTFRRQVTFAGGGGAEDEDEGGTGAEGVDVDGERGGRTLDHHGQPCLPSIPVPVSCRALWLRCLSLVQSTLADVCRGSRRAQSDFRRAGGVETAVAQLRWNGKKTAQTEYEVAICVADVIWAAVAGNRRNERQFLEAEGLFYYLDLLELSADPLQRMLLALLSDLLENREAVLHLQRWSSRTRSFGAVRMLLEIWIRETDRFKAMGDNGIIRSIEHPLYPVPMSEVPGMGPDEPLASSPSPVSTDAYGSVSRPLTTGTGGAVTDRAATVTGRRGDTRGGAGTGTGTAGGSESPRLSSLSLSMRREGKRHRKILQISDRLKEKTFLDSLNAVGLKRDSRLIIYTCVSKGTLGFGEETSAWEAETLDALALRHIEAMKCFADLQTMEGWTRLKASLIAKRIRPLDEDADWVENEIAAGRQQALFLQLLQRKISQRETEIQAQELRQTIVEVIRSKQQQLLMKELENTRG